MGIYILHNFWVKQSGLGREGAELGLEEYTDVHYLAVGL